MKENKSILVINCGSSSIKYSLFSLPAFNQVLNGVIENIGQTGFVSNHHKGVEALFKRLKKKGIPLSSIKGVGHRVVHGGEKFTRSVKIDKKVIATIRKNFRLAPLHNPANLEGILACKKFLPKVKQVAVFDTAFHQTMPEHSYLYALPYDFYKRYSIRRYGFHGTSHQYVAKEAARKLNKPLTRLKLITVHLGNGCSITAIDKGKSVDTSMGFTPLEGLVMGTRSGDIDPAVLIYLFENQGLTIEDIGNVLNKKSGLIGISGLSNDMRKIKKTVSKSQRSRLALDMFIYRIKKYIGAYIAVLKGCDALVFTAGIGENNPDIVKKITSDLGCFLKKKPKVMTIPTKEELMIARLTGSII
jgi:acetate kinase